MRCVAGTGVVPEQRKCTSSVPFVELEFAEFDALEAETRRPSRGMEPAPSDASGRLERPLPIFAPNSAPTQEIRRWP